MCKWFILTKVLEPVESAVRQEILLLIHLPANHRYHFCGVHNWLCFRGSQTIYIHGHGDQSRYLSLALKSHRWVVVASSAVDGQNELLGREFGNNLWLATPLSPALTHVSTIVFLQQLANDEISERDFSVSETRILTVVRHFDQLCQLWLPQGLRCGNYYCCGDLLDWFQNSW